jgi:hypothetical protein
MEYTGWLPRNRKSRSDPPALFREWPEGHMNHTAPIRRTTLPKSEAEKKRQQFARNVSMTEIYRIQYRRMHHSVIGFMINITVLCFLAVLFFLICMISVLGYITKPDVILVYIGTVAIVMTGIILAAMVTMTLNFMGKINPALKSWASEQAYRAKFSWAGGE